MAIANDMAQRLSELWYGKPNTRPAGGHDGRGARRESYLAITGARSRDVTYLEAIEAVLMVRQELVHYRVLCGPTLDALQALPNPERR